MDNDVYTAWSRELKVKVIILNIIIHISNFSFEFSGAQRCTQLNKHVSNDFPEQNTT